MSEIIRLYRPEDETAVSNITYRTGFKGEDLTGRDFFTDRRLFFLLFTYYYTRFEPEHFFVTEKAESGEVIGFICGTLDSAAQEKRFTRTMVWRILLHIISVTIWRYPRTIKALLAMVKMVRAIEKHDNQALYGQFPAHLHINLLPGYQGLGLGKGLIRHFEEHMIRQGASGLNLGTTNHNRKAIPFYEKLQYTLYRKIPLPHPVLADLQELIYVKRLKRDDA